MTSVSSSWALLIVALFLAGSCSAWPFWPVFEPNPAPPPPFYYHDVRTFGPQAPGPNQPNSRGYEEPEDVLASASDVVDGLSHLRDQLFSYPSNETGERVASWHESMGVNPEELGEYAEGDILYPAEMARNGISSESARWPNGVVPFVISSYFNDQQRQLINEAMADYHKFTCIRFKPYKGEETDYIRITAGNTGCWSSVGRTGGRQDVNLQVPGCVTKKGTVIHELMHAIGFLHEQSRYERDEYVSIQWPNIQQGRQNNFEKSQRSTTHAFGVGYDYGSVMHYSARAFSRNGQPTIIPKGRPVDSLGQRDGFSRNDIEKIRRMYKCSRRSVPSNFLFNLLFK